MKKASFQKFKSFLGIILMVSFLACIYFWESTGREKYLYTTAIVASKDIEKGTKITKGMLGKMKIEETKIVKDSMEDPEDIIGKESTHFIPAKSQIHKSYIDDLVITVQKDEFIFKIPNEWLIAIPQTIRRKDSIELIAIKDKQQNEESEEGEESNEIKTYESKEQISELTGPFVLSAKVAYVKDSGNREVIDVGDNERINGSSQVNSLEIIIKKSDVEKLKQFANNKYKFLAIYR